MPTDPSDSRDAPSGRLRRARSGKLQRFWFPALTPAAIERSVDEAVLIMQHSITMATKNQLLLRALRDHLDFDGDAAAEIVAEQFRVVAREHAQYADALRFDMADFAAQRVRGEKRKARQYADYLLLAQRRVAYSAVASRLTVLAADTGLGRAIVDSARTDAWAEVGESIEARLVGQFTPAVAEQYENSRGERLADLVAVDLAALADLQSRRLS